MTTKTKEGQISIRPYITGQPNGGLEKYDLVVVDGALHSENIGFAEHNGIKRYLTGLNEMAPEVQRITDPEKKEAVIRDIRNKVVYLENILAGNHAISERDIDEYDKDGKPTGKFSNSFWQKVTTFNSQGPDKFDLKGSRIPTFWDSVEIRCGNKATILDPENPKDLITIYAIQAGGFTIVAPSLTAAKEASEPPKFYLDREEETAILQTALKKLRNDAGTELNKMYRKDAIKLLYVTKLCGVNSLSYRKRTSLEVLYNECEKYIEGEKGSKKTAIEKFIQYAEMPLADLRVQAIVKDAVEMHLMIYKNDGNLYYGQSNTSMGRSLEDVVKFLKNPLNQDILTALTDVVEKEWDA